MVKEELVRRSPLRILERSIHGGLKAGDIGVIVARKGVGKTACLVHIATDQLLRGKHVIHVSFRDSAEHIIEWYEDIFAELSRRHDLDCAMEVHDTIIRNRVIMNFRQDGIHITQIEKSIRTLIDNGEFGASVLVVDGYDFSKSSVAELKEFRSFAKGLGLELWFSATLLTGQKGFKAGKVPEALQGVVDEVAVVVCLRPENGYIRLELAKDRDEAVVADLHLRLDTGTLLIAEE